MDQIPQSPTCLVHGLKIEFVKIADNLQDHNIFYCFRCLREKQCANNTFIHISTLQSESTNLVPYFADQTKELYNFDNFHVDLNLERELALIDLYLKQIEEQAKKLKNEIIQRHKSIINSVEQFNRQLQKMNMIFNSMQFKEQIQQQINQLTQQTFLESSKKLKDFLQETIDQYQAEENVLKQLSKLKFSNKQKIFQTNTQLRQIENYLGKLHNRITLIGEDFDDRVIYNQLVPSMSGGLRTTFRASGMHLLVIEIKSKNVTISYDDYFKDTVIYLFGQGLDSMRHKKSYIADFPIMVKILLDYDQGRVTVLADELLYQLQVKYLKHQKKKKYLYSGLQQLFIAPNDASQFNIVQCI